MTIRVLIADDHILLRAGLRVLLNATDDIKVIGETSDGSEVLPLAKELQPNVVLMDISMPNIGGIKATCLLKQELPEINVLILTIREDISLMQEAIQAGASGYILKRALESELIDAIKAAYHGDVYIHPAMTRAFLDKTDEVNRNLLNS